MPNLTLRERLKYANISIERACELFGRTERTLWNWNANPPSHVLEVIKLHGSRHRMPEGWENWYFDRHWLVDPDGNAFNQRDVKNLWIERQVTRSIRGDTADIYSLKLELERRLEAQKNPAFTIEVKRGSRVIKDFVITV